MKTPVLSCLSRSMGRPASSICFPDDLQQQPVLAGPVRRLDEPRCRRTWGRIRRCGQGTRRTSCTSWRAGQDWDRSRLPRPSGFGSAPDTAESCAQGLPEPNGFVDIGGQSTANTRDRDLAGHWGLLRPLGPTAQSLQERTQNLRGELPVPHKSLESILKGMAGGCQFRRIFLLQLGFRPCLVLNTVSELCQ